MGVRGAGDEKGRGVVAERALRAGELAYRAGAWVAVVAQAHLRTVCAHCLVGGEPEKEKGGAAPALTRCCEACRTCFYCSEACRGAARGVHALECASLATLRTMVAEDSDTRGGRLGGVPTATQVSPNTKQHKTKMLFDARV